MKLEVIFVLCVKLLGYSNPAKSSLDTFAKFLLPIMILKTFKGARNNCVF